MSLFEFVYLLFGGGLAVIFGLTLVARGLQGVRGASLRQAAAELWRDPPTLAGLWLVGDGGFCVLLGVADYAVGFRPATATLAEILVVVGFIAMLSASPAVIRLQLMMTRLLRSQLTQREPRHDA
jgi:hypothetical protein